MKTRISIICCILSCAAMFPSCDLTENMQVQADKATIFGSESGLKTYAYSFYEALPSLANAFRKDAMCDYAAVSNTDRFIKQGAYNSETSTDWSWGALRNINYFIDGCNDPRYCTVEASVRDNYIGIAKWFRAWFYYDKLVTYGEVPWFENEIQSYQYDVMYKNRDSRDVIIRNIMSDLDFAYNHIEATSSTGSSTLTKWAAAALKSRICLFEASYRKYHGITGMEYSAEELYAAAAEAAAIVMNDSGLSLNTSRGQKGAYRDLFYREEPITSEVILAVCANEAAGIFGEQNWWYHYKSYGLCWSLVRPFMNLYLMLDGTPYTSREGYDVKSFREEVSGRDERLAQTVRTPGFTYDGKAAVANIKDVSLTGYQVIKYTLDDSKYDGGAKNINSIPLIRYAEVLLNLAECAAEVGNKDSEVYEILKSIRQRAGITANADGLYGLKADMTKEELIDAVLFERRIELAFEGKRFWDMRRRMMFSEPDYKGYTRRRIEIELTDAKKSLSLYELANEFAAGGGDNKLNSLTYFDYFKTVVVDIDNKFQWDVEDNHYFFALPKRHLEQNRQLEQTMGWNDGTFDPLL